LVLLSDAQALAQKAEAAGVPADLEVWEGMYHVWPLGSRMVPESRRAIDRVGTWFQDLLIASPHRARLA
jgi:acetyl esterase/lipase